MSLAERLRQALAAGQDGELALLTGDVQDEEVAGVPASPAAVLIAVTDRAEPGVLLTVRTATLSKHPGQIAFPGGRIDASDVSPTAAALREAHEEIGLPPHTVDVVGIADRYRTVTGFDVTPVLGVVPPDLVLAPNPAEVADVFEVPLAFVLENSNHLAASAEWRGRTRHFYEIMWDGRRIWGATAAIIVNLSRRLQWTA
ncbi:CoA pyrophosphatase [Sphingomonas endolithica]|uniref:CoA pyrophosphatase n=1 Tax=Sphingomonas endolithica TaxID=2972485 RepID=UPI0021AF85DF|nr:CoA pyrophosphatase [Sphingomonas sp. ZFBP2030]